MIFQSLEIEIGFELHFKAVWSRGCEEEGKGLSGWEKNARAEAKKHDFVTIPLGIEILLEDWLALHGGREGSQEVLGGSVGEKP